MAVFGKGSAGFLAASALAIVLSGCSGPTSPGPGPPDVFAMLDSEAAPHQITLRWSAGPQECIDPPCPPPPPPVRRVSILMSSEGMGVDWRRVEVPDGVMEGSITIDSLADGQAYWFEAQALGSTGALLATSHPIMTIPGPVSEPTLRISVRIEPEFDWAPSGDSLAVVDVSAGGVPNLCVLDLDTGAVRRVTDVQSEDEYLDSPAWANDGNRIALTYSPTRTVAGLDYRIWSVDPTGAMSALSSGRVDYGPVWGGGRWLYFMRGTYEPPNIGELWRLDPAHPESAQAITHYPSLYKYHPTVRRSDDLVVFEGVNEDHALYSVNPSSGVPVRLTGSGWEKDTSPSWVPDGRKVVFISWRSGHPEVWVVDAASRVCSQLTRGSVAAGLPLSARVAPDGRRIAVLYSQGGHFGTRLEIHDFR